MSHVRKLTLAAGLLAGGGSLRTDNAVLFADAPRDESRVTLTERDVEASNQKVAAAYGALVSMWDAEFKRVGEHFVAPRIARYRGPMRSSCGILPTSNAMYCGRNNTIYYDDVFLAAQSKLTGAALGSDGDMAGVGIVAHEMGHAVTAELGVRYRSSYAAEAAADCLAGAFAKHAQQDGSLEKGDLEEAFFAMAAGGDERGSHGTREQRQENFRSGFDGGGKACVPELR